MVGGEPVQLVGDVLRRQLAVEETLLVPADLAVIVTGSPSTNPSSVTPALIVQRVAVITDPAPVDVPLPWVDFDGTAAPSGIFEGK